MAAEAPSDLKNRYELRAHVKAFRIPPVHDALIVGLASPIGGKALLKAIELVINEPFTEIPFEGDDVIALALVRSALLRRLPAERLRGFLLDRVKPLMSPQEILHLDLFPEVVLEGSL